MPLDLRQYWKKREVKAFAALVLLALLLLLLSPRPKPTPSQALASPSPIPQVQAFDLSIGGTPLRVERSFQFLGGRYSDTVVLSNKGNSTLRATGVYAIPKAFGTSASNAEFSELNSFNSRFLSQNPLVQASDVSLPPGASSTKGVSYEELPAGALPPAFFFAALPPLDKSQEAELRPMLAAIADFGLEARASLALGKALSELFARGGANGADGLTDAQKHSRAVALANAFGGLRFLDAQGAAVASAHLAQIIESGAPLEERLQAASLYHSLLRRASAYAALSGSSQASVLSLFTSALGDSSVSLADRLEASSAKLSELESKAGTDGGRAIFGTANNSGANASNGSTGGLADPYAFFPIHPDKISFELTETLPRQINYSLLVSGAEVGYPVGKFSGGVRDYASFAVITLGREINFSTTADVGSVVLDEEGQIPFDSLSGNLTTLFFSLPNKTGSVPIEIAVKHNSLKPLLEFYAVDYVDDPTVDAALALIKLAAECNPLGKSAFAEPDEFRGAASGAIFCPGRDRDGRVGAYGRRFHPVDRVWKKHFGIDISATAGTPIHAAQAGVVTALPGVDCGLGIRLDHGTLEGKRFETKYCHASKRLVSIGDEVKAGQVIGLVGSTGKSTGPHLHFEVLFGGKNVDPAPYYSSCTQSLAQDAQIEFSNVELPAGNRIKSEPVTGLQARPPASTLDLQAESPPILPAIFPPAQGEVISVIGDPRSAGRRHQGIDVEDGVGSQLYAMFDGIVQKTVLSDSGKCGLQVNIQRADGVRAVYCHLSEVGVSPGTQVRAGQPIGKMGMTGNAKGTVPHLHLQIHSADGSILDPCADAFLACKRGSVLTPGRKYGGLAVAGIGENDCLTKDYFYGVDLQNTPASSGTLSGSPSISAQAVERILNRYKSPALAEPGFAQCVFNSGTSARIDPAFALAWAVKETTLGSNPRSVGAPDRGKNLVGMTCGTRGVEGVSTCSGRFKRYNSYCDSVRDWYAYMNGRYISRGLGTVERIVPIYAPAGDGNYPAGYVSFVKALVAKWRLQENRAPSLDESVE